jgi:hypothetical protein
MTGPVSGVTMKALTIWQPWASLIAIGAKPYEFRSWYPPASVIGRRIAIHAGARKVNQAEVADLIGRLHCTEHAWTTCLHKEPALDLLDRIYGYEKLALPLSHILCTAILGRPYKAHQIVGEFGGVINDSDRDEHSNWAWPLTDIELFTPPVPARGGQGFWNWTSSEAFA